MYFGHSCSLFRTWKEDQREVGSGFPWGWSFLAVFACFQLYSLCSQAERSLCVRLGWELPAVRGDSLLLVFPKHLCLAQVSWYNIPYSRVKLKLLISINSKDCSLGKSWLLLSRKLSLPCFEFLKSLQKKSCSAGLKVGNTCSRRKTKTQFGHQ